MVPIDKDPVSELIKLDESSFIFIDLRKELLYVWDGYFVGFEGGDSLVELCEGHFFVVVLVDVIENGPVDVVIF